MSHSVYMIMALYLQIHLKVDLQGRENIYQKSFVESDCNTPTRITHTHTHTHQLLWTSTESWGGGGGGGDQMKPPATTPALVLTISL